VVYEANRADTDGDWASEDTVRAAMYEFMERGRDFSIGHSEKFHATVLECFQAEADTKKGSGTVRKGAWYMALRIEDEGVWALLEKGELTGLSWEGQVLRERDKEID